MNERSLRSKRRQFLKGLAVGGGGAALAGLAGGAGAALEEQAAPTRDKPVSQGYRETAHVREYYEKARF